MQNSFVNNLEIIFIIFFRDLLVWNWACYLLEMALKQYELSQSTSAGHIHNTELHMTSTVTTDGNLPRGGREWWSTQRFSPKNRFQTVKKDTSQSVHLLWIDFNIPLCEVIFSFVAIAMLQGRKREAHQLTFKTIVHMDSSYS